MYYPVQHLTLDSHLYVPDPIHQLTAAMSKLSLSESPQAPLIPRPVRNHHRPRVVSPLSSAGIRHPHRQRAVPGPGESQGGENWALVTRNGGDVVTVDTPRVPTVKRKDAERMRPVPVAPVPQKLRGLSGDWSVVLGEGESLVALNLEEAKEVLGDELDCVMDAEVEDGEREEKGEWEFV